MKVTGSELNTEDIESYLFLEMSEEDRATVEALLFENDELFFEVEDQENRLVDLYASGKLTSDKKARFERSLTSLPARRDKVANALALKVYIDEERPVEQTVPEAARETLGQKLAKLFSFGSPAAVLTMAALMVVFMSATVFLVVDNREKSGELARLRDERNGTASELQATRDQFDREHETVGDLSEENEAQRNQIANLSSELRERESLAPVPKPTGTPRSPTTSVTLARPDRDANEMPITMGRDIKRVVIRIPLPAAIQQDKRLAVELNGHVVALGLPVRVSGAEKSVHVTALVDDLHDGPNQLRVLDDTGSEVTKYTFNKKKD